MVSPTPAIQKRKTYTAAEKKVNSKQLSSFIGEVLGVNDAKDIINKARKGDIGGALKSTVVAAAMLTPGGKVLKGARLAAKATKAAKAAEAVKELRITKGLVGKKGQATLTRAEKAKITPTPAEAAQKAAVKKDAAYQAKEAKKVIPTPSRTVKRDIVQKPGRKPLTKIPSTKAVPLEPKPNTGGGLKTTTGQGRKTLPAKDVTDIAKERTLRPSNSGRVRDVKKPSLKSLTPHEKRYEELGKKAKVTITKKKPMTVKEISVAKAKARKAKFDTVLARKPISKADNPLYKKINPKVKPEPVLQPEAAARAKGAVKKTTRPSDAPPIEKGRGNTQQPPSVTTQKITRTRELRMEARKARQANKRDRRTDVRESESTPRMVEHNWGSKLVKKPLIKTNHPKNAASDAGNMREKLKEIDAATAARTKKRELYKGNNKVSPELKAKVDKTLGTAKKNATERKLQNVFNKPVIKLPAKGRLTVTRPIKPVKK